MQDLNQEWSCCLEKTLGKLVPPRSTLAVDCAIVSGNYNVSEVHSKNEAGVSSIGKILLSPIRG